MTWNNPPQPQSVSGAITSPKARVIWHEGKLLVGDRTGWRVMDAPDAPTLEDSGQRRHGRALQQWTTAGVSWYGAGCSTCGWNLGGPAAQWITKALGVPA